MTYELVSSCSAPSTLTCFERLIRGMHALRPMCAFHGCFTDLVEDMSAGSDWGDHRYVRSDLHQSPLKFTLDLSAVNCGCLACVYLVAMEDPSRGRSNYCDMAENVAPGYGGDTCYEIDILEANNHAMQTAIHTKTGGKYGSGQCDRNGCFARIGGPQSPSHLQNKCAHASRMGSMPAPSPFLAPACIAKCVAFQPDWIHAQLLKVQLSLLVSTGTARTNTSTRTIRSTC